MPLHVFSDSEEYVVASDEADARIVMREICGSETWPEDVDVEQMPDDKHLTILEDGVGAVKKTYGEWASIRGRGYLCCSAAL